MGEAGVVIVGAGECGTRAAFALREEGYTGPVTLIGSEHHLPYERPPLSKDGMALDTQGMKVIASRERFEEATIRLLRSSEAVSVDRSTKILELRDGSAVPYAKLLLATGARPRRLALAEGARHCLYLRTHDDALTIAARLAPGSRIVIIGGGFIGLELAAAARARECDVTVLEAQQGLLLRAVPREIADVVAEVHRANGVDIRCGAAVTSIRDAGEGVEIRLDSGSVLTAELCIVGIGAEPDTALASGGGLDVDNGISVNEMLRTSDPEIFAAGDCCSFPLSIYDGRRVRLEAWRNAQEQGALAARNMLGREEAHTAVPWFWSDQYDLTLQVAGLADEGKATVRRDVGENTFILFHIADDGRLVAASGIAPGNTMARDTRLAEMLIARRARPSVEKLSDPETKLKSLLAT